MAKTNAFVYSSNGPNYIAYTGTSPIWDNSIGSTLLDSSTQFKNNNNNVVVEIPNNDASLKVNGKIILNEENIDDRLKRIEDMLHIPQRNVIMEEKYEKLKRLWQEYNETLEAIKTWETIKESK